MIGFHIDFNLAHFKPYYLKKTLKYLAENGYDTILWEVENAIDWENCPECVREEAYKKKEFKDILSYCKDLGLDSIPLFQTLGHCEYVLKNKKYIKYAEDKNRNDQYCPLHPDLLIFLIKWIDEYFEVFGKIKIFHLGADEAFSLGTCDDCEAFSEKNSLSKLYVQYINTIASEISSRGARPAIWADMLLHHNDSIDQLSKEIILFDWMYDIRKGDGRVYIWGKGFVNFDQLNKNYSCYWKYLFPNGDEPGRIPETFYSADYLTDHGFDVVTCPSSSCFGDSVFAPRTYYHLSNIYDSVKKGFSSHLKGSLLTSWTIHLFPYELQRACIELPGFLKKNHGNSSIDEYIVWFLEKEYGIVDKTIFDAYGLLAKPTFFSECCTLGYNKSITPVEKNYVEIEIKSLIKKSNIFDLLDKCKEQITDYKKALNLIQDFSKKAEKGNDIIDFWTLAAKNLINRGESVEFMLKCQSLFNMSIPIPAVLSEQGKKLLVEMKLLRNELGFLMKDIMMPVRGKFMIEWIYNSIEYAMEQYLSKDL